MSVCWARRGCVTAGPDGAGEATERGADSAEKGTTAGVRERSAGMVKTVGVLPDALDVLVEGDLGDVVAGHGGVDPSV